MDGVKSVSLLHFLCCLVLFSVGSVSSTDKLTPMLHWPYVDGTVLINSLKFQQVLTNSTKFQYITWNICISKCASVDHLEWLHVASMDFNKRVRIEHFTDSNLYDLDTRGILIINNQTGRNNGAYYRIDIRLTDFGIDSEYFKLLHFEDQQVHTGPACPEISNLTCAVCNCSISNSTLPANDTQIAHTCPACPDLSNLNCTLCNCSNGTQTVPLKDCTLWVAIFSLTSATFPFIGMKLLPAGLFKKIKDCCTGSQSEENTVYFGEENTIQLIGIHQNPISAQEKKKKPKQTKWKKKKATGTKFDVYLKGKSVASAKK